MSTDDNRSLDQTLSETQLKSMGLFLGTMTADQLRGHIVNAYRRAMHELLESNVELVEEEQVQRMLATIEPPERLLDLGRVSIELGLSPDLTCINKSNDETNSHSSLERQGKIGLLLSGLSGILLLCTPGIFVLGVIVLSFLISGLTFFDLENIVAKILAAIYFAIIPLIAVSGIGVSLLVRTRLQSESGNFTGYKHTTWGLAIGVATLLSCLFLALLFGSSIYQNW